ncbi:3-oxoadipate enol-lactonase [Moraxella nasibovis]|uniref:3-oxoadipate enol-lactonase n=1 Tax=Moraxella nasibovis TaxID=2904120 RepID=UPI0024100FD5|nr:3-oxoadipate enol-lactonase [Moraxella nasibovis]WFF38484.1 3-oxoadipate enol-lactonase [Moraxella nasibovis]
MPIFQNKDVSLNYQTFGEKSKPALIFSNSLGTNYTMWQAQIDALKDDFFIICYDTRGHGQSSTPNHAYTIDELGGDVVALLDFLGVEKANFCGISMGGLTGIWLAIHAPHKFNKIIVSNTAAKIGNKEAWQDRANSVRENGLQAIANTAPSRWFTDEFIAKHPDAVKKLSDDLAKGDKDGYANCCEALAVADLRDELKNAQVSMLVIAGENDPVTTVTDGEFIVANAPNASLATINASHIANVEQSNRFCELILTWLK